MRGITEERLIEKRADAARLGTLNEAFIIDDLLNECREISPWQAIETAPKDRRVLLFYPARGENGISFQQIGFCPVINRLLSHPQPTHWQELPEDPK